jgi:hypothetical protein
MRMRLLPRYSCPATTLVPCGHVFCKVCVQTNCPTCSAIVKSTVTCRPLDNMISVFARENVLDAADVDVYRERMKQHGAVINTYSARKKRRCERKTAKLLDPKAGDSSHPIAIE